MKKVSCLIILSLALGGCLHDSDVKKLTITERQLLDARHDHLRCEVKLDRLRDLYKVPLNMNPGGLLDSAVHPENPKEAPTLDAPLSGGHDAPLTGDHDAPLTGGHDAPLTGDHDYADALREATLVSASACWDNVNNLYLKFNVCVVEYKACVDGGATDCLAQYETCLTTEASNND